MGEWIAGEGEVSPEASQIVWIPPADAETLATTPDLLRILARAARLARVR